MGFSKEEIEVFNYLNSLRLTGVTNMFGATPYIEKKFNVDRKEASALLILWMENYNEDGYN